MKFDVDFHEDVEEGGKDLEVVEGEGLVRGRREGEWTGFERDSER